MHFGFIYAVTVENHLIAKFKQICKLLVLRSKTTSSAVGTILGHPTWWFQLLRSIISTHIFLSYLFTLVSVTLPGENVFIFGARGLGEKIKCKHVPSRRVTLTTVTPAFPFHVELPRMPSRDTLLHIYINDTYSKQIVNLC